MDCETCPEHSGVQATLVSVKEGVDRIEKRLETLVGITISKALATGFGIGVPIAGALVYLVSKQ